MVVHLVLRRPVPVPAPQIRVVWQGFRTGDAPEARWTDGNGRDHRWSGTRGVPWLQRDALREGEEWKVNLHGVPADVSAVSLFLSSSVGRTVGVMVQPLSGDPNAAILHPGTVLTPGTAVEILEFHRAGPGWQVVALNIAEATDPAGDLPPAVQPTAVQPPGVPAAPSSTPEPAAATTAPATADPATSGPAPGAPGTFGGWSGPVTDAPAPRHRADDAAAASATAHRGWGPAPAAPRGWPASSPPGQGPAPQPPAAPDERIVQVPTPGPWPTPPTPASAPSSAPTARSTPAAATPRWDRSTAGDQLDQGPQVPIPDRLAGAVDAARSTGAVRRARVTAVVDLSASMYPWIASGILADVLTATQAVAGAAQRPSLSTRFLPDGADLEFALDAEPAGKLQEQLRVVGLRTGDRGRLVEALAGPGAGPSGGSAGGTDTVTLVVTDDPSLAAQAGPGTTAVIVGADPDDRSIGGDHAVAVGGGPVDVPRLARELAQRCFTTARR